MKTAALKTLALFCCLAAVAFALPAGPVVTAPTEAPKVAQPVVPETTAAPTVAKVTEAVATQATVAPAVPAVKATEAAKVAAETTVAPTVAETKAKDMVRICTCDEVKECNAEVKNKTEECKTSCDEHLSVFGNDTAGYKPCFKDVFDEFGRLSDCFKNNAEGYCMSSGKAKMFIEKPDYSSFTEAAALNETDGEFKNQEFATKARKYYVNLRKYQNCAVSCLKKEAVKCYEKKSCGVSLPDDSDKKSLISGTCALVEPMMRSQTALTCSCLAFQKGVKDMQTSCGLTASPYYMRNI